MITEPTPIDSVKTVICPKCQHSYYVDLHMSLKERVICAFCKQEVNMAYQEPAKLCQCNSAPRDIQTIDAIKTIAHIHFASDCGYARMQINVGRAFQKLLKLNGRSLHATMYINPTRVPARNKYEAAVVKIQEVADNDNLKIDNEKVK